MALLRAPDLRGIALTTAVVGQALFLLLNVIVLYRFGFLASVVSMLFTLRLYVIPIALDFSAWYAGGSIVAMLSLSAVAVYGFHTALAGRPIFKDELLEARA